MIFATPHALLLRISALVLPSLLCSTSLPIPPASCSPPPNTCSNLPFLLGLVGGVSLQFNLCRVDFLQEQSNPDSSFDRIPWIIRLSDLQPLVSSSISRSNMTSSPTPSFPPHCFRRTTRNVSKTPSQPGSLASSKALCVESTF
jgi:hypothetical protein